MKKHTWRIRARSYCWLPLIVVCAGLPAHADLLSYTADSSDASGTWTVTGFDPSKGTLNSVKLNLDYSFSTTLTNNSATAESYKAALAIDLTVDQPDGSTIGPLSATQMYLDSLDPGKKVTYSVSAPNALGDFTDSATLAEYTAPSVSLTYDGSSSGLDLTKSMLPGDFSVSADYTADLTVVYDYTPSLSAVPEPTAVILLGTLAAICLWTSRRRFARGAR